MLEELTLVKMASAMARHASARHRVVAENVANADTPGFRARDVRSFDQYVKEAFTPRASRPGHAGARDDLGGVTHPATVVDAHVQAGPNGNSVSLEHEMIKSTEVQGQHALALAVYRKAHDLLRLGLGRGR